MAREFIEKQDTLNDGREKLNRSITRAYDADEKSDEAIKTSNEAKQTSEEANDKSDYTQVQLDTVTGASTIDPAVEQLKVGSDGQTYPSPDARIRTEHEKVTAQLAQNVQQSGMDFVELLRNHNQAGGNIFAKKISDRRFEVAIPYKDDLSAYYLMGKDPNDDYMKLMFGKASSVKNTENIYMKKDLDSSEGFAPLGAAPNMYTRGVGNSKLFFQFDGTGFSFNHYGNSAGGVWEFNINDGEHIKSVSTWREVGGSYTSEVIKGLVDGVHNVVATFRGADPDNEPSDTPRGWYKKSPEPTFNIYKIGLNGEHKFDILNLNSNKEFAIATVPTGKSGEWIPEHGGKGTAFAVKQEIYFDNKLVTDWTGDNFMKEVQSVKVIQDMKGYHSTDTTKQSPLCDITTIHTFNSEGVSIQGKLKFLVPLRVTAGYVMMFPVYPDFAQKLITNNGYTYASTKTDGSSTNIVGEPTSFAFVNENGTKEKKDMVVAMTILNPHRTLRKGESNRRSPLMFLDHRDSTIQKLYPMIIEERTFETGESFTFGGIFHIGEFPFAAKLLY